MKKVDLWRLNYCLVCYSFYFFLIIGILIGCARKESTVITIEFVNWESSPEGMRFTNKLIKEFENQNPNIEIKNVIVAIREYESKLLTSFAGNLPPDIFEIQAEIIHPFLKKDLLLNLTPYINKSSVLKEEDFFDISLQNFRYNGKEFRKGNLYGFPKDLGTAAIIYNKDLFDQDGLPYPDITWDESTYLHAAQKLTKRDSAGRIYQIGIERPINWLHLTLQKGGYIWNSDYTKCMLDSKEAISAAQFSYDLSEKHGVAPKGNEIREGLLEGIGFKTGKAAMSLIWRYELPDMIKYSGDKFKWDVSPLLTFGTRRIHLFHGPSGWAISKTTKHPEECFKFMEFLVGSQGQIETAKMGWNIPGNKSIAYSDYFLKNLNRPDSEKINRVFLEEISYFDISLLNPFIPVSKFYNILEDELDPSVVNSRYKGDISSALYKATKRINSEIEKQRFDDLNR